VVITNWDGTKGNYVFYNNNPPLSVGEDGQGNAPDDHLTIYPQPADDRIVISISDMSIGNFSIRLSDLAGRSYPVKAYSRGDGLEISTQDLMPGTYILTLAGSSFHAARKIIVN
jgi:hypothetical protein